MTIDILRGIAHLVENSNFQMASSGGVSGGDSVPKGKAFEVYCKDWLSTLRPGDVSNRNNHYDHAFSYQGAANNPPDVMYRGGDSGDAFEFKKYENAQPSLALNSSYPKDELHINSPGINKNCMEAEKWQKRSFYYIVGHVPKGSERVLSLWVVDGKLLAASSSFYSNNFQNLKNSVDSFVREHQLKSISSKELGRIHEIDPCDRTTLRVRSMWELMHPAKAFERLDGVKKAKEGNSVLHALILNSNWNRYSHSGRDALLRLRDVGRIQITDINAPNPNGGDPVSSKLVRFEA